MGLGLSIAAEIAKLHGGVLSVRDAKLGGAEFVLLLPICGNRPQVEEPAASQSACRKEVTQLMEQAEESPANFQFRENSETKKRL